jgi:DnaJ-class molecular chaperone
MIISRKKAEEAAAVLEISLEGLTNAAKAAYHAAARKSHPDLGGSAQAFARVDWAKHVVNGWLDREEPPRPVHQAPKCVVCDGEGRIRTQRGFKQFIRACDKCHGTGDAQYEPDLGAMP